MRHHHQHSHQHSHQRHHDDLDGGRDGGHEHGRRNHRRPHRDGSGHGRRRARRGAIGTAVLALLDERPMHGYELITAFEEKSGGRWKPSPGSIYPALRRLEHRGFITAVETDDDEPKRRFELTDLGRQRVAEHRDAGHASPWDEHDLGDHGELRRAIAELVGPARQIGRFGTPAQTTSAAAAVKEATAKLYRILADGVADADPATDPNDAE